VLILYQGFLVFWVLWAVWSFSAGWMKEGFWDEGKSPFIIDAWVLLPDHMHCLWTLPRGDRELGKRWAMIKRLVTQQCPELKRLDWLTPSRKSRNESTVWQRRFREHLICDDIDFKNHLEYIHYNPVKHGLCEKSIDCTTSTKHVVELKIWIC